MFKYQILSIITPHPIEVAKVVITFLSKNENLQLNDKFKFISFSNCGNLFDFNKLLDFSKLQDLNSTRASFLSLLKSPQGKLLSLLTEHKKKKDLAINLNQNL